MTETIYRDLSGNNLFGVHLNDDAAITPLTQMTLSQSAYDGVANKDPNMLYIVTDAGAIVKMYFQEIEYLP